MQEEASTTAIVVQSAEFHVNRDDWLPFVPVEFGEVLGASAAAKDDEDVAPQNLVPSNDPSHAPSGGRYLELEVGSFAALFPNRSAVGRHLLETTLAGDDHKSLRPQRRPLRGRVRRIGDDLQRRPVEDGGLVALAAWLSTCSEHKTCAV